MRARSLTAIAIIAVSAPIAANASLVGSSVTGTLLSPVTNTGTNYFDPASGDVPSGYGNSAGTTVTVVDPGVEFAFLQGGGTVAAPGTDSLTADFTGSTLTLNENIAPSSVNSVAGFETIFKDSAFVGLSLTKTSDDFVQGGVQASLVGDQLTLTVGASCTSACSWTTAQAAQFSLTPVPLPAAVWLFLNGLGGIGIAARKKRAS